MYDPQRTQNASEGFKKAKLNKLESMLNIRKENYDI